MLGLPLRTPGAPGAQLPRGAERRVRRPGHRSTSRTTATASTTRSTSPTSSPTPILLAALAPVMLRVAGEHASGTILWMADERAIGDHIVPRITKAAAEAGRPRPRVVAGVPVALCANDEVDAARAWANQVLGHAEYSPNYERLLEQGDATRRRRPAGGGRRVRRRRAAAELPRRRRHRSLGPDPAARARPRGAHRVAAPHRGVPRLASAPSSESRREPRRHGAARRHPRARGRPHPRRARSAGCCSPTSGPT